jgi:hypothetical protein
VQRRDQRDRRRILGVVGIRLERQTKHRDRLAADRTVEGGDDFSRHRALALPVDGSDRLDDAQRHAMIVRGLEQSGRILREARAAEARTGMQELAMRLSSPMPRASSCTSAPAYSHKSAISLMKVILVARKALDAYLISSAVRRLT